MAKKVIAIYPGRFQPFGRHHYDAFKWLASKFGKENTFIATSNKVELPKSPLGFEDKLAIISKYGIGDRVELVKNPYRAEEITQKFDPKDTALVFMVGEKDMQEDPRFKIGFKKDGSPGYFQRYIDPKKMESFDKHGYLVVAPHVSYEIPGIGEMSGTNIRKALSNPNLTKDQFESIFGWYDKSIHDLMKKKFSNKNESLAALLESRATNRLLLLELLKEGGNAIPSSIPVKRDDIAGVISKLKKEMPSELVKHIKTDIGSSGYKIQSGDIDVFVDEDEVLKYFSTEDVKIAKKQLQKYFQDKGLESVVIGRNVHVGIPYENAKAQVDVMVIKDAAIVAPWHQHGPRGAYEDPEFKGSEVFILLNSIGKALGYKFDAFGAKLLKRDDNKVVARGREEVAKILLNPSATESDLNSVKSILKALENDPKKNEKLAQAKEDEKKGLIRLSFPKKDNLNEADSIRIQHPEDLIYWEGSKGAKKAIDSLKSVDPKSVSVKWDGSPAVIFGYDEKGNFIFTDKNAFAAKGYEGKTKSASELAKMIIDRGKRSGKDYTEFGKNMASVFDKAKNATPKTKGYYAGDMLYFKKPELENGSFVFKPNVVKYEIPKDSDLGKKIQNSDAGLVVHYFSTLEGKTETADAKQFKENSGLLVLPPVVASIPPKVDRSLLSKASSAVSNAYSVDKILDKSTLSSAKISDLPEVMYNYTNNRVENLNKLGVKDFVSFISSSPRLSESKKKSILSYVQENASDFENIFDAVKAIAELKNSIISQLEDSVKDVKSYINGVEGGEGYVINVGGDKIKLVNRGKFTAANRAIQR